jgi:type III restriction enzyme
MSSENPILNSPYDEPKLHYATDADGSLKYNDIRKGRRIFSPDIQVMPSKQGLQGSIFELNDFADEYGTHIINLCRKEIANDIRDIKNQLTDKISSI